MVTRLDNTTGGEYSITYEHAVIRTAELVNFVSEMT